jgi:hypothetical protein
VNGAVGAHRQTVAQLLPGRRLGSDGDHHDLARPRLLTQLQRLFQRDLVEGIDADILTPSVTTPEPSGLTWMRTL